MSQKAAVVVVLDVGYSKLLPSEEGEKFLQTSRECASMTIQSKIFARSKDDVGLVLMGCNDCNNHDGDTQRNIKVSCPLGPSTWHMVRNLNTNCTNYCEANWVEAVLVALNLLRMKSGKFSEKKIAVFTSNLKLGSFKKLSEMECGIQDQVVDLILIHPRESPNMAELNCEIKNAITIVEKVDGTCSNIDEAANQLLSFQKKKVKPRPWNVCLDIGSNILIPVSGYKKLNESQHMKWENCLSDNQTEVFPEKAADAVPSSSHETSLAENLSGRNLRISRVKVNTLSDGKEVEKADIIDGYHFGSSIVPFTEEDKLQLKYESGEKCLSVVNITKKIFVPRHYWIEKSTTCFVARDDDEDAAVAFSAIVNGLHQLESVAIVRRLYYNNTKPHIGALFPVIKSTKEYLVFVELPFSNHMRKCLLPEIKVDHLTPEQFEIIDQLIDGMDLSDPMDDDEESMMERQWSSLLQPHKVSDPYLQHVRRCVASKILNPGDPLPSIDPNILKMLTQPPEPIKKSISETLDKILNLFPNLEPHSDLYKKGRGKRRNTPRVAGSGDLNAGDGEQPTKQMKEESKEPEIKKENEKTETVGILSPVEDFRAAVDLKAIPFLIVCKQMQEVITKLVVNSFEMEDFEKPKESLRALRSAVIASKMDKCDAFGNFNDWMKDFYQLLQEKLKAGFWNLVVQENLGFVTCDECSESNLTMTEVHKILGNGASVDQMSDDEEMDLSIDI